MLQASGFAGRDDCGGWVGGFRLRVRVRMRLQGAEIQLDFFV